MSKALIIIDIQNDYFEGGACELVSAKEASLKAKELLEYFRENKMPVFHVQHTSLYEGATFFLPDTYGMKIHENLKPREDEPIIEKNFPNSFLDTSLEYELKIQEIKELVICGMMSHMCVDATTRAASDMGYGCTVVHDACTTRDLEFLGEIVPAKSVHNSFMAALEGTYAKMVSCSEIVSD